MTNINNGRLVKTFEASFDKPQTYAWRVTPMIPSVFLGSWVSISLFKLSNLAMSKIILEINII